MRQAMQRVGLGLALTAATLVGAGAVPRLAGASGTPWPKLAAVALLGESVLLVMAARRGAPPAGDAGRGDRESWPDPLPADPRWLWIALPTTAAGLALFLAVLLFL